jgi:putative SOS response-associated peptidase YedK
VWTLPAYGERALLPRSFRPGCWGQMVASLEHCAHANDPHHPATCQGTDTNFQSQALGADSVSYWAKDASIGLKTINAMSETAAVKPVFRDAFKYRRCLVPADGFDEWKDIGPKQKQAYNFGTLRFRFRLCGIVEPLAST